MEITSNLAIGDWYVNTTDNDLLYWGLDYPPLTAYHSLIFGKVAKYIYPEMVTLNSSKGFETKNEKTFMRATVILSDIIVTIPATLILYQTSSQGFINNFRDFLNILSCLILPALMLIDHGHFQYNGVCIGFALFATVAILNDHDILGSILFCLSLNFKQMSLYYALIFFSILLRKSFNKKTTLAIIGHIIKLGIIVIITFGVLWLPFCILKRDDNTCLSSLLHVLSRQFPFSRGIFEDKVANICYSLSVVFDFRLYFSIHQLAIMSLILTLLLQLPICLNLIMKPITFERFLISLMNGSLAFFLASFQVIIIINYFLIIIYY